MLNFFFAFLYDIAKLAPKPCVKVFQLCQNLVWAVEYNINCYVNELELKDKLKANLAGITKDVILFNLF